MRRYKIALFSLFFLTFLGLSTIPVKSNTDFRDCPDDAVVFDAGALREPTKQEINNNPAVKRILKKASSLGIKYSFPEPPSWYNPTYFLWLHYENYTLSFFIHYEDCRHKKIIVSYPIFAQSNVTRKQVASFLQNQPEQQLRNNPLIQIYSTEMGMPENEIINKVINAMTDLGKAQGTAPHPLFNSQMFYVEYDDYKLEYRIVGTSAITDGRIDNYGWIFYFRDN